MRRYGNDRRLIFPLLLILVGLLFLLGNFGLFDRFALWRVGDLWPLLLVLIGGLLVINRLLAPQPAQLASLGLVAILVIVAAAYVLAYPVAGGGSLDLNGPVGSLSRAQLNLEFGASGVEVRAVPLGDDLYRAHFDYSPGEPAPTATLDRERGTVTIQQNPHFNPFGFSGSHRDHVVLRLNARLPWTIHVTGGASQMTLDLGEGHVAGVQISGGASQMDLTLPAPQGTIRIEISGGASQMHIRAASGSAARISITGGVGTLNVNGSSQAGIGQLDWETPSYASATDRYDIQMTGGASTVTLDTR
jgi:cell wall-active antibiotic response 4TMS protein YvqF